MPLKSSQEIERRLNHVLRLIRTGRYSTPKLAEKVGVSIPTISRIEAALKERGHNIRAKANGNGCRYVFAKKAEVHAERNKRTGETNQVVNSRCSRES